MHWSDSYVGIPFCWNGYSVEGAFCYGLVWLVQREVFGRELPRHDEISRKVGDGVAGMEPALWMEGVDLAPVPMDEAREGDILKMWGFVGRRRAPLHVGVMVDRHRVLHTEAGTGAIIEDIRAPRAAWRPIEAYRLT